MSFSYLNARATVLFRAPHGAVSSSTVIFSQFTSSNKKRFTFCHSERDAAKFRNNLLHLKLFRVAGLKMTSDKLKIRHWETTKFVKFERMQLRTKSKHNKLNANDIEITFSALEPT